jgi:hypothetical protein
MVVCKFWQQGSCRFGGKKETHSLLKIPKLISSVENCRFEHPGGRSIPNGNRFSALQNPDTSNTVNKKGYQNAGENIAYLG